ncbi:MAG: hypothetical protein HY606_10425 [Planctomycetes bacterium]|nr:hypothetical protein [Planctomycetota bacterium]
MRIIFLAEIPQNIVSPFAIYKYDEVLAGHLDYINIREIIQNRSDEWLDEIDQSFARLSSKFLRFTRWWWVAGMSRLDARPWAQEQLFKPLFFARAFLEWLSIHQDTEEVFFIGCPCEVAIYLKEFKKDLVMKRDKKWTPRVVSLFSYLLIAVLKLFKNAVHILRHHLFRKAGFIKSDVLVLYESVTNVSLTSGYKFHYDGLFDALSVKKNVSIAYGCVDSVFSQVKDLRRGIEAEVFFLIDNISFVGFLKSIFLNIYLIFLTGLISLSKNPCQCGEYKSFRFWPNYLLNELSRSFFLTQICGYYALSNIFKKHRYQCVISTYEEKMIERAVLFSCREAGIPVIGYTPHPQHSLALCLRNVHEPRAPKPDRYAVCGSKYVDYFLSWGHKNPNALTIWGSKKSLSSNLKVKSLSRKNLKVLVLISHPNELSVFHSWLRAESRLTWGVRYFLRIYQVVNSRIFSEEINSMTSRFDFVEEIDGDFKDNINACQLAAFCGTSAGLLAINYGLISIHLGLDDFFKMNPCFNDLNSMLACASAVQFADCLDKVCRLDENSISALYHRQKDFVDQVFAPIQELTIERDIVNANGGTFVPVPAGQ